MQLKVLEHARNQEGGAALGSHVCSGTPETERRTKEKYVMESKKVFVRHFTLRYTMQTNKKSTIRRWCVFVCVCVCVCVSVKYVNCF